jgi:hypothetical protein
MTNQSSQQQFAGVTLTAELNARVQPLDRGDLFEDPLQEALEKAGYGAVDGGGSMLDDGEIKYCDIAIRLNSAASEAIQFVIDTLEELGAPKGSKLHVGEGETVSFGKSEGLAVYLNGTDLPDEIYAECDSNFVYNEFDRLLEDEGRILGHWNGPAETALYMYGGSFEEMKRRLAPFIENYPLCQKCRIVRIA